LNPHTVVLEEVPDFLNSGACQILLHVLKRLYKNVDAKIINPVNYGSLTGRNRAVIIAQDKPVIWPEEHKTTNKLGDIFEDIDHKWFDRDSKSWLFDHWDKQTDKGNGFASQIYTAQSDHIGTIKKRYFAQQGDNPVIRHPALEDTYRWLTLNEVKRLHGIPDNYYLGESMTTAGEVIGQGVVVDTFKQVIETVTKN
jgi:DNA (cytosine-5)-methyltransferase 1